MGAMQRNKGARGEREVVDIFRAGGYPQARRVLAGDGRQPGDVLGGPADWLVEVKWWSDVTAAVREGLKQAHEEAAQAGQPFPMVAVRLPGDVPAGSCRTRWVAVFHADTWTRCPSFGAMQHVYHTGTVPARLALALNSGGLSEIGKGLFAMPLVEWLSTVGSN